MNWFLIVVGGVMLAVGIWGWRNISRLISSARSEDARAHQEGVLQRGAAMLLLTGSAFVLFGLYQTFAG